LLNARYDAVLEPFKRGVSVTAATSQPFVVYGAESLVIRTEVDSTDELVAVAGSLNTYTVPAGTTLNYSVFARNAATDRTLNNVTVTFPGEGLAALGEFSLTSTSPQVWGRSIFLLLCA
jgi:hypothetical protein